MYLTPTPIEVFYEISFLDFRLFIISVCVDAATVVGSIQRMEARTPPELQLSKSQVEPDADAEALLWDVYVADEDNGGDLQTVLRHYVKIKIFNERDARPLARSTFNTARSTASV